jgi:hypothetical protein
LPNFSPALKTAAAKSFAVESVCEPNTTGTILKSSEKYCKNGS